MLYNSEGTTGGLECFPSIIHAPQRKEKSTSQGGLGALPPSTPSWGLPALPRNTSTSTSTRRQSAGEGKESRTHTRTHTHAHTQRHTRAHIHTYTHAHIHKHSRTHKRTDTHAQAHTHIHAHTNTKQKRAGDPRFADTAATRRGRRCPPRPNQNKTTTHGIMMVHDICL